MEATRSAKENARLRDYRSPGVDDYRNHTFEMVFRVVTDGRVYQAKGDALQEWILGLRPDHDESGHIARTRFNRPSLGSLFTSAWS
jgi:hypothetical protein